jgi:copper chaperone CopZ
MENNTQSQIQSQILRVKGMHCAACLNGITFLLKHQDGIGEVDIEWNKGGGTVEYDPEKINPEKNQGNNRSNRRIQS